MILREEDFSINNSVFDFADSLCRLDEEISYSAEMIPIRHIESLGENLIQLEDFIKFSEDNSILNIAEAMDIVCSANGIDNDSSVGFIVNEAALYENADTVELANTLINHDIMVYSAPIAESSVYYQELLEAFEADMHYDTLAESPALQEYIQEGYVDHIKSNAHDVGNFAAKASDHLQNKFNTAKAFTLNSIQKVQNAKQFADSIYASFEGNSKMLANKYAAAKRFCSELCDDAKNAVGDNKAFLTQQANKMKEVVSALGTKLRK